MSKAILRSLLIALPAVLLLTARPDAFAATALSACGTISTPGQYVLTKDLTSSGTCFVITASGVALDFGGHSIGGNGTMPGAGIGGGGSNIIIANGTIGGFGVGINFTGANVAIVNMTVSGLGNAIVIEGCCNSFTGVTVYGGPQGNGIVLGQCCNSFRHITVQGANGDGIDISGCCNEFADVSVGSVGGAGVRAGGSSQYMSGSTFFANEGGDLVSGDFSTLTGSTISGGGVMACGATLGASSAVTDSKFSANPACGASLGGNSFVSGSVFTGNGRYGVNSGSNSIIIGSTASGNAAGGTVGFSVGNFSTLVNDVAENNAGSGVIVVCPSNVANLTALNNNGGNLIENTSGGACTNLNNRAPSFHRPLAGGASPSPSAGCGPIAAAAGGQTRICAVLTRSLSSASCVAIEAPSPPDFIAPKFCAI